MFIMVLFSTLANMAYSQHSKGTKKANMKWLKAGTKLVYTVDNDYDFTVTVKNLKKGVVFNFSMKKGMRTGNITITPEAFENATKENNYFHSGDETYTDKTTVWVSKVVYNSLKNKKPISINPFEGAETLSFVGEEIMNVKIDGKIMALPVLHGKTDRGSEYWILDNPKSPLILHMILNFDVAISEIITK